MSTALLCRRRITTVVVTSIVHEFGLGCEAQADESLFLHRLETQKPDMAFLTNEYMDRPDLFAQVRQHSPTTRTILCILPDAPTSGTLWPFIDILDLDVVCLLSELPDCLQAMKTGGVYHSSLLSNYLAYTTDEPFPGWNDLTESERRILTLTAEGKTSPQIASMLHVSPKTVDNHKYKISQKLNVKAGPCSLVKFALMNREKILALADDANKQGSYR